MKRLLMALALMAAPAFGQDDVVNRLVTLKYADPQAARYLLANFGVSIQADRQMKVVALTGKRSAVETAEAALKQLDVPSAGQKDIDLSVYFIVGRDDAPTAGVIPQDLQSTVAALKQTFPYQNYELLDALSLRSRSGSRASTTGQVGNNLTDFSIQSATVEDDGKMIRIDGLNAKVRQLINVGGKSEYTDVSGVRTDVVDVKEGQKLVVGRSSLAGSRAMFVVLIAKVAQ